MEFRTLLHPIDAVRSLAPETFSLSGVELAVAQDAAERAADRVNGIEVIEVRERGWFGLGETCEVTIRGSTAARRSFRLHTRRLARLLTADQARR